MYHPAQLTSGQNAKEVVKAVCNHLLEGQEQIRKLPLMKAWAVLADKLGSASEGMKRIAPEQRKDMWPPKWDESKVIKLLLSVVCSAFEKFCSLQLDNVPGSKRMDMLFVALTCIRCAGTAVSLAPVYLQSSGVNEPPTKAGPLLLGKLDADFLITMCEATCHAVQLVHRMEAPSMEVLDERDRVVACVATISATIFSNWNSVGDAAGTAQLTTRVLAHPACVQAHSLIAEYMTQRILDKPAILDSSLVYRTVGRNFLSHTSTLKDETAVPHMWRHSLRYLHLASRAYLSQQGFKSGEIQVQHTACMEHPAFMAIQLVLGLPPSQQNSTWDALALTLHVLVMRALARQLEGSDPTPCVEAVLQVLEHLMQQGQSSSVLMDKGDLMKQESVWTITANMLLGVFDDAPKQGCWPIPLLVRVIRTCEAAIRHAATQPTLIVLVEDMMALQAACLMTLLRQVTGVGANSSSSSSSGRDKSRGAPSVQGPDNAVVATSLHEVVLLYLSTLFTCTKAALAVRHLLASGGATTKEEDSFRQPANDLRHVLTGSTGDAVLAHQRMLVRGLKELLLDATDKTHASAQQGSKASAGAQVASDASISLGESGSGTAAAQAAAAAPATAGSQEPYTSCSLTFSAAEVRSALEVAIAYVIPVLMWQRQQVLCLGAEEDPALIQELCRGVLMLGNDLKGLVGAYLFTCYAGSTIDMGIKFRLLSPACSACDVAAVLARRLLAGLPELPASVDSALRQPGGLQRLEALYRPPEVPGVAVVCLQLYYTFDFAKQALRLLTGGTFSTHLLASALACIRAVLDSGLPALAGSLANVAVPSVVLEQEQEVDPAGKSLALQESPGTLRVAALLLSSLSSVTGSLRSVLEEYGRSWAPPEPGSAADAAGSTAMMGDMSEQGRQPQGADGGSAVLAALLKQCDEACSHLAAATSASSSWEEAGKHVLDSGVRFAREELQVSTPAPAPAPVGLPQLPPRKQLTVMSARQSPNLQIGGNAHAQNQHPDLRSQGSSGSKTLADDLTAMIDGRQRFQKAVSDTSAALLLLCTQLEQVLQQQEGYVPCNAPKGVPLPMTAEVLQAELLCGLPKQLKRWGCSNPWCTNLRGPSEVELRTSMCAAKCGARYCSKECQMKAWKEGHKRSCACMVAAAGLMKP